jgi:hypothetical protein
MAAVRNAMLRNARVQQHWAAAAVVVASGRSNFASPLAASILPLLPSILSFADFDAAAAAAGVRAVSGGNGAFNADALLHTQWYARQCTLPLPTGVAGDSSKRGAVKHLTSVDGVRVPLTARSDGARGNVAAVVTAPAPPAKARVRARATKKVSKFAAFRKKQLQQQAVAATPAASSASTDRRRGHDGRSVDD